MIKKIQPKTKNDIAAMAEGGKRLSEIKMELWNEVEIGKSPWDIEVLANKLIKKTGGTASFKMVDNYYWATCVNINKVVVHGIPKKEIVFKKGDVVSVDVGLFYKGFHTDTSFTVGLSVSDEIKKFIETGSRVLKKALNSAVEKNRIYDISKELQKVEEDGYSVVKSLVGHGIGRKLHEEPFIPCFVSKKRQDTLEIPLYATFALEIMYAMGSGEIETESDGWTIVTQDGKISALFEETVAVCEHGPFVLTKTNLDLVK